MPSLLLIRGASGSGKSTLAQWLSAGMYAEHFEADSYFYRFDHTGACTYKFDPSKLYAAHKWCQEQTRIALLDGMDVIVSNTSTTEEEIKVYEDIARECKATFFSVIKENRHGGVNVHGVPEMKVWTQKERIKRSMIL